MSHNTIIKDVKINDLDALRAAITELKTEGVQIDLNETARKFRTWEGQPDACDICIQLPRERFDVGLVRQPDGSYLPVYDHMLLGNGSISCEYRPGDRDRYQDRHAIAKLVQRYGVVVAEKQLALDGHNAIRQTTEDGSIQVIAETVE